MYSLPTTRPWWQTLYDLRATEGGWEYPERYTKADIRFLKHALKLREPIRILDLGCGTGRHAIALARLGHHVTGLDYSQESIKIAFRNAPKSARRQIQFVVADMRQLEYDAAFDAVIMLDVSFGLFDQRTNLSILKRVQRALRPGGRLLLELFNPKHIKAMLGVRQWESGGRAVTQRTTYDTVAKVLRFAGRSTDLRTGRVSIHPVQRLRIFTLAEIRRFLKDAYLDLIAVYAGHQGPLESAASLTSEPVLIQVIAARAKTGTVRRTG